MNLNKKITLYREQANMSKSELARLIGVSPSYITKLENGEKANPSLEIKIKIANALEVPPSFILDDESFKEYMDMRLKENRTRKPKTIEEAFGNDNINTLLYFVNKLNDSGQKKVISYAKDLSDNPKYDKGNDK